MKLKDWLKKAQREKWAIGQFNISNLETLRGIIGAAKILKSPVIVGTSEGESRFMGLAQVAALVKSFREEFKIPVFLNLDHGKTFEYIKEAIGAGYDAVHFDGSDLLLEENIKISKDAAGFARKKKVLFEGEVGKIGGELTGFKEAEKFVELVKPDSLAVNIGTWHGLGEKTEIDFEHLKGIKEKVKNVFLVLHGGSGVPKEHIGEVINRGVVKININSELRLAYTNALKGALAEDPQEIAPYKYLFSIMAAVQKVVEEKMVLFGSGGR